MSDESDDNVYDVEEIKAKRVVSGRTEYLVKWKGYDEESWEPSANILDDELIREFANTRGRKRGKRKKNAEKVIEEKPNKRIEKEEVLGEKPINGNKSKRKNRPILKEEFTIKDKKAEKTEIKPKSESKEKTEIKEKSENIPKIECVEKKERNNGVHEDKELSTQEHKIEPPDNGVQHNEGDRIDSEADVKCVLGATEINGQIYFLIQWSDENKEPEPFSASEANLKWPQTVIAFYEKHFEWSDK